MDQSTFEPLSELQKQQYLSELGLEPVLSYYNNEIKKHSRVCFKKPGIKRKKR